ncbi:MAG: hypothetical protein ACR2QU_02645 [Gammaproteobacteria bacterium]
MGLPVRLIRRIALLDNDSLDRIACCPFSLCSYAFHDLEAWHALLRKQVRDMDLVTPVHDGDNARIQFVIMSLAVVRELAANETHAASLFFGMPRELGTSFAKLDLAQLPFVASSAAMKMHVRLARQPRFWTELIGASAGRSPLRLGAARALGLQLTLQRALRLTGCRLGPGRLYRRM